MTTRTEAIEKAARALVWQAAAGQIKASMCDDLNAALKLPPDPAPSVSERERALALASVDKHGKWGHWRGCATGVMVGCDCGSANAVLRDIPTVIAAVNATHPPERAEVSASVRAAALALCGALAHDDEPLPERDALLHALRESPPSMTAAEAYERADAALASRRSLSSQPAPVEPAKKGGA